MRYLKVSHTLSVTDFMHMGDEPFTLDVVSSGIVARFVDVVVRRGEPCELSATLTVVDCIDDDVTPRCDVDGAFQQLVNGPSAVVTSRHFDNGGAYAFPVVWSGGQAPASRTFTIRDFCNHVVATIEAALDTPIAA